MKTVPLPKEVVVRNVDNTTNVQGTLKEQVFLAVRIKDHQEVLRFYVSDLGKDEIILGHNWLKRHNPNIDWRDATINLSRCNFTCQLSMDDKWRLFSPRPVPVKAGQRINPKKVHFDMKRTTQSTTLAATENLKKKERTIEEMVPEHYLNYRRVFEEQASQDLPPRRKYDHAIDLKEGTEPSNNCKIYPLNPEEQIALDVFLEDMLKRGYIRPSKSPFASPFFFVKKKDGKLRPVQDYRRLNTITIKNQYPLPLIPDVIDKLKDAQIFTKFDV